MAAKPKRRSSRTRIPESCTSYPINIIGLVAYLIFVFQLNKLQLDPYSAAIYSIGILAVTIIILEKLSRGKKHSFSSGVLLSKQRKKDLKRVGVKLLGLYATLAVAALIYWLLPVYREGFYRNYFRLTIFILPFLVVFSIPYFLIMDRYMKDPNDSHWHVGMLILGKRRLTDTGVIKNHILGWLVKLFFLALMFPYLISNTQYLTSHPFPSPSEDFGRFYDYMYNLIFAVDLVFVCAGYLLTLKIFDSHIRSAEPTFLGWMVALYCYDPFWSHLSRPKYLNYEDGYYWGHMLYERAGLYGIWGSVILVLLLVYVLATVAFGIRFSNLTNRGIITNGPYRWMKHPAYISKNIAWWLISIPFISNAGPSQALKQCLLLLALNLIYYLRAITEERHLSLDPTYVRYATAMNERGVFRKLYLVMPVLAYRAERYVEEGKLRKLWF